MDEMNCGKENNWMQIIGFELLPFVFKNIHQSHFYECVSTLLSCCKDTSLIWQYCVNIQTLIQSNPKNSWKLKKLVSLNNDKF